MLNTPSVIQRTVEEKQHNIPHDLVGWLKIIEFRK